MDTLVYGGQMLYRNYLEMLLGSRVKVKVLRTLCRHRGKEFTIRELAEFLNVSHMGVRKALNDLYKMNAIRIRVIGKSHTIALNAESYAGELADKVFRTEEETLGELVKLLKKGLSDPAITSALIFGSVARGEEDPLSDIDLFILTKDKEKAEVAISELQREVSNRFGNAISPYILSQGQLADKDKSQILEEIRKKHIVVRGEPLE
jgi:predicted nucleotidyltransferase